MVQHGVDETVSLDPAGTDASYFNKQVGRRSKGRERDPTTGK
jgi:hypothetical protein